VTASTTSTNAITDPDGRYDLEDGSMNTSTDLSASTFPLRATTTDPAHNATPADTTMAAKTKKFAVPGRTTRKRTLDFKTARRRKNDSASSITGSEGSLGSSCASVAPLVLAVVLWYSLGVVSISSSKVLLTPFSEKDETDDYEYASTHHFYHYVGGLPPLFLTVQQLLLGSTFLRLAIKFRFLGLTKGIVPLDALLEAYGSKSSSSSSSSRSSSSSSSSSSNNNSSNNPALNKLAWTGIYFALGFLTTNLAFGAAAPTYVETLKAAEPISSAVFAVLWGIERLTLLEVVGLLGIVGGVLLSTNGSNHAASMSLDSVGSLTTATAIVMASNLCFSLRGLYQKLFRKAAAADTAVAASTSSAVSSSGRSHLKLDDLNLQFRMQQTGVALLIVPTLVWHGEGLFLHATGAASHLTTPEFMDLLKRYLLWSVGNGLAFSSYNLASTYLLTRISVVHHAALNCTRRIFAIVCTGLLFRIPISVESTVGIGISFCSFLVFTWAKSKKNNRAKKNRANKASTKRDIPNGNGTVSRYGLGRGQIPPPAFATNTNTNTNTNTSDQLTHRKKSAQSGTNGAVVTSTTTRARATAVSSASTSTTKARTFARPPPNSSLGSASVTTPFRYPPPPPPPPRR